MGQRFLARREALEVEEEVVVLHSQSQVGLEEDLAEVAVEGEVGTPWQVGALLPRCVVM